MDFLVFMYENVIILRNNSFPVIFDYVTIPYRPMKMELGKDPFLQFAFENWSSYWVLM